MRHGSLGTGTAISNIEYNNIYTWQSNQMYMIKTNGAMDMFRTAASTTLLGTVMRTRLTLTSTGLTQRWLLEMVLFSAD